MIKYQYNQYYLGLFSIRFEVGAWHWIDMNCIHWGPRVELRYVTLLAVLHLSPSPRDLSGSTKGTGWGGCSVAVALLSSPSPVPGKKGRGWMKNPLICGVLEGSALSLHPYTGLWGGHPSAWDQVSSVGCWYSDTSIKPWLTWVMQPKDFPQFLEGGKGESPGKEEQTVEQGWVAARPLNSGTLPS